MKSPYDMKVYPLILSAFVLLFGLAACSRDDPVQDTTPIVNESNDSNHSEVRPQHETFTNYAALRQALSEQAAEATNTAADYARLLEYLATDTENLTPEAVQERLGQIRIIYLSNPALSNSITGLGIDMEATVGTMITGVILIVAGLFLAYMGRRIFKAFLIVSGFLIFSSFTVIVMVLIRPHISFQIVSLAFWAIAIIGGIIGAVIFYKSLKFAVYCMSCYGGMLVAFWALGMIPEIKQYVHTTVFVLACSSLAGICTHYMDEMVVIVSSSLAGAFTAFFGLDMIKPNGFRTSLIALIESSDAASARNLASEFLTGNVRNYMIGVLFVTVTGIYVQYRHQPRSYGQEE